MDKLFKNTLSEDVIDVYESYADAKAGALREVAGKLLNVIED